MANIWRQSLAHLNAVRQWVGQRSWFRKSLYVGLAILALVVVWKILSATMGWSDPQYKTASVEEGPLSVMISASGIL